MHNEAQALEVIAASQPVTSTDSPMKYRPGTLLAMVCCDSSRVSMPPHPLPAGKYFRPFG
jgi:hypothetical protein